MNYDNFNQKLAGILEVDADKIRNDLDLRANNWDSLSVLAVIALIDELYNVTIPAKELTECKMVGDITALICNAVKNED